jgi:alkyldihydroxyacetonephosphate synthase
MTSLRRGGSPPPGPLAVAADRGAGSPARVWGWGPDDGRPTLPPAGRQLLRRLLGAERAPTPRVEPAHARLPDPALTGRARERLERAIGAEHVSVDRLDRLAHARGKSYEDLVLLRAGEVGTAPDAVVRPKSHEEMAAVLEACAEERVAVVPFGGGTSVVGGVEAARGGLDAVVSLDLSRLDRLLSLSTRSLTATFEAGVPGRRAEALLDARGLTLGHFPQSFEYATLGGYLATRSAGQASTGHGRFEDLVLGLRCATPAGELRVDPVPASAAGPSLLDLVVGSEGVFGVVTEATLAIRARPEARRYEGWSFPSFAAGAEALRALAQSGAAPDVARLSDEAETRLALAQAAAAGSVAARALRRYLHLRGHRRPCLVMVGWEGQAGDPARRRRRSARLLRAGRGLPVGAAPGRAWARTRFEGPYLRDDVLDLGVLAETLETATTWDRLEPLHRGVTAALQDALRARGTPPIVGCHVSHLYRSGASLYFTVLARQERGAELEQWRAAKAAASDAIVAGGGTITHHHAIGTAHRQWMEAEAGELGLEVLRAVKDRLDPAGIMNPGKLLP